MSTIHGEAKINERCKAAAWVWYQRGSSGSSSLHSGALLKRRRRRSSSTTRNDEHSIASRVISPQPSRFKREAHYLQSTQSSPDIAPHDPVPAAAVRLRADHDQQRIDHSHSAADADAATKPVLQNPIIGSCDRSPQSSPAPCRNCLFSPTSSGSPKPAALDHCADCCDRIAPAPRRKSASLPPVHNRWSDKLFSICSRKSLSSSQNSVDSLSSVCSSDYELDSFISLADSFSGQMNGNGATVAAAAFHSLNSRSSLLDSFELCAVLKKLGYVEPHDHDLEEQVLSSSVKEARPVLENDHHDFALPRPAAQCKQSLYDLLGWSERGLNIKGCSYTSEEEDCSSDHYYHVESSEINISTCSSSNCSTKAAAQVRQCWHRRPGILMTHLPHSFSNALHHMHLPQSFSNALHHLPHSFSNALNHLPQLPHSFSNALHQINHSLSSAYRHLHAGAHRQNADDGVAHINDTAPNGHHSDSTASPHHHAHAHRHLIPSSLRHLLSFKSHRSPLHPSCDPAYNRSVAQTANCSNKTAPTLVQHHLNSSPSFNQHLYKSDDYMLIYSSAKKHSNHHDHHHHHYHHHYVF